jgi:hypothetical protein
MNLPILLTAVMMVFGSIGEGEGVMNRKRSVVMMVIVAVLSLCVVSAITAYVVLRPARATGYMAKSIQGSEGAQDGEEGGVGASKLTVEEHPIAAQEVDAPDHLEYLQRISPETLNRRRAWREPHPVKLAEPANQALAAFGYRLEPAYGARVSTYHLLRNDTVIREGITRFGPVTVNERGDDFALLIEIQHRNMELVQRGTVRPWDPGPEVLTPPVYYGSELITAYQKGWEEIQVRQGKEVLHTVHVQPHPDNPVRGLWAWNGKWVLEADGQVIIDGQNLGQDLGYDEVFGWALLRGAPFYFFSRDGQIRLSYAGETLPYIYEDVVHNRCCEPAAFNAGHNDDMVWFHALRDGTWHYVEAGVYR